MFEIGDVVICLMDDNAVFPVIKNHKYTITNITVDELWGNCYWIENYNKQYYDEWEFDAYFKLDNNYKRKLKLQKIEKLNYE